VRVEEGETYKYEEPEEKTTSWFVVGISRSCAEDAIVERGENAVGDVAGRNSMPADSNRVFYCKGTVHKGCGNIPVNVLDQGKLGSGQLTESCEE
jgi:hypothetical protein